MCVTLLTYTPHQCLHSCILFSKADPPGSTLLFLLKRRRIIFKNLDYWQCRVCALDVWTLGALTPKKLKGHGIKWSKKSHEFHSHFSDIITDSTPILFQSARWQKRPSKFHCHPVKMDMEWHGIDEKDTWIFDKTLATPRLGWFLLIFIIVDYAGH